jgi:hypothetical protein
MLRAGEIVQENELETNTMEGQVLRTTGQPRVSERPAGRRDLSEIPPSELFVLLDRTNAESLSDEILFRKIIDHYGFTRLTIVRRKYLNKVLSIYKVNKKKSKAQV